MIPSYPQAALWMALSAAILTPACTQNVALISRPDGRENIGQIEIRATPPHRMKVVIDGRAYEGDVREEKIDDSTRIAARYGRGSRQAQAYLMGGTLSTHRGKAVLQSDRGDTIRCDYIHRGNRGEGICESDEGVAFDLVFQQ